MVLRKTAAAAAAAFCGLLALACIPKQEPVRAAQSLNVAVAAVHDQTDTRTLGPVPDAMAKAVLDALAKRNLKPRLVPLESLSEAFAGRRTTEHRLNALSKAAPQADLLVLLETTAGFYSQLNGRYRWTVGTRTTMARAGQGGAAPHDVVERDADHAIFLDYDHERAAEALAAAAPRVADRVGDLADDFLGGASVSLRGFDGPLLASAGGRVALPARTPEAKGNAAADSIYFVLVDRFANGDPSNDGADADPADPQGWHGGDLQGVLDRLDHLQALGVKTVWISPVFDARTEKFHGHGAYHGYWIEDFDAVEPRFGDEALLKKLSDELHRRGMRLVLDVVLNHVAPDAPLSAERPEWFHRQGAITDWNDATQLENRDVFGLPDLAQENEEVYAFLLASSLGWLDRVKPDGFRLDAARHVPMSFWARYTADVRKKAGPDFHLLGEMYDGDTVTLSRTLRDAGFDAVFDFPLYFAMTDVFCKDAPVSRLGATLFSDRLYDDPSRLVTFLDNHDLPRVVSACGGDPDRVSQALAFLLTARGTPSLTYGTESALEGAKEPANRADMRFDAQHRHFGEIRRLLGLRDGRPSLTSGAARMLAADERLFAYARITDSEVAFIAVNRDDEARRVRVPADLARRARRFTSLSAGGGSDAAVAVERGSLTVPPGVSVTFAEGTGPHAFAGLGTMASAPRTVVVRASGLALGEGETAWLVGSGEELGRWDPARAAGPLVPRKGAHEATIRLPAGGVFEWKLVVRGAGDEVVWEEGPNRPLFVEDATGPLRLRATWRASGAASSLGPAPR